MKYYVGFACVALMQTFLPWATQGIAANAQISCELGIWIWVLMGGLMGWLAEYSLPIVPQPLVVTDNNIVTIGALAAAASYSLPPTTAATPALAAFFGLAAATLATARTATIAASARRQDSSAAWSVAAINS